MLTFLPIYQSRLWGGRRHATLPGRTLPAGMDDCGESWEISDRPEAMSRVFGGPYEGCTLHELWENHREELFGPGYERFECFPILAKILAPEQVLSVQIHPDAATAAQLGSDEKNECWYFADADGGRAELFAGFPPGTTGEDCRHAFRNGDIARLMQRREARPGESIFIPAGTVHALGAHCLVYEIQQNADTTYRIDDWGRLDKNGHPRELHRDQALACMQGEPQPVQLRAAGEGEVAACPHFTIREVHLKQGEKLPFDPAHFAVVTVIEGLLEDDSRTLQPGSFGILTAGQPAPRATSSRARVLVTTVPASR